MKRYYKYITAVALLLISILLYSQQSASAKSDYNVKQLITTSPNVPNQVTWCGETIVLDRIDLRERFERELTTFTYGHSVTLQLIKRANRYYPIMQPILKEMGVPEDLIYLATIESYLNPRVVSPAKAAGIWQIMPKTAKELGLDVETGIDERYSIERATVAACKYLQEAYAKYGNWVTVAASYNAGMNRVSKELEAQQCDTSIDLWLVEETSRYVFRILAIKHIMESPQEYGFAIRRDQLYPSIRFNTVEVTGGIEDLAEFAKEQGISYAQLKEYNSWLTSRQLPNNGKSYNILIPYKEDLYYKTNKQPVYDKRWTID